MKRILKVSVEFQLHLYFLLARDRPLKHANLYKQVIAGSSNHLNRKMEVVENADLFKNSNFFYFFVGLLPYENIFRYNNIFLRFIHLLILLNTILVVIVLGLNIAFYDFDNLQEAIMAISNFLFAMTTLIKVFYGAYSGKLSTVLRARLLQMFPKTIKDQNELQLHKHVKIYRRVSRIYMLLFVTLFWVFNFLQMGMDFIYLPLTQGEEYLPKLPYYSYIPWQWSGHWSYYFIYISEMLAGGSVTAGMVACDLLLAAFAMQIIMHFNYLAKQIEKGHKLYKLDEIQAQKLFLKKIAKQHQKLLSLVNDLNTIFQHPLFVNLIYCCSVIFLCAFQMLNSENLVDTLKYMMAASSITTQISIICFYGQFLADASTKIAEVVYQSNWSYEDKYIKDVLSLITMRAQKPAGIEATFHVALGCRCLAMVMDLTYKFYCVLNSLYHK